MSLNSEIIDVLNKIDEVKKIIDQFIDNKNKYTSKDSNEVFDKVNSCFDNIVPKVEHIFAVSGDVWLDTDLTRLLFKLKHEIDVLAKYETRFYDQFRGTTFQAI